MELGFKGKTSNRRSKKIETTPSFINNILFIKNVLAEIDFRIKKEESFIKFNEDIKREEPMFKNIRFEKSKTMITKLTNLKELLENIQDGKLNSEFVYFDLNYEKSVELFLAFIDEIIYEPYDVWKMFLYKIRQEN